MPLQDRGFQHRGRRIRVVLEQFRRAGARRSEGRIARTRGGHRAARTRRWRPTSIRAGRNRIPLGSTTCSTAFRHIECSVRRPPRARGSRPSRTRSAPTRPSTGAPCRCRPGRACRRPGPDLEPSSTTDTSVVDCSGRRLFEQAGSVRLTDQVAVPDDRLWRQLVNERSTRSCSTTSTAGSTPTGATASGRSSRRPPSGPRATASCAAGCRARPARARSTRSTGAWPSPTSRRCTEPGTCLAIDGRTIGDPIECAGQHAVEAVGVVDLAGRFPEAFPRVGDQDGFLQPECGRIATEYAGGPEVIAAKKLTVYWDNLTEESWKAGTRKVNCNLAALLPDRSGFAPVTGPVRGDVVVGETPAPPASGTRSPAHRSPRAPRHPRPRPPHRRPTSRIRRPTPVGPPTGTSTVPAPPPPAGEPSASSASRAGAVLLAGPARRHADDPAPVLGARRGCAGHHPAGADHRDGQRRGAGGGPQPRGTRTARAVRGRGRYTSTPVPTAGCCPTGS